ncbi:FecR domain-containing protein [Pseudoalteromonas luteoviolacea]|uniref:FecR family protein n=1 Tax=Pseudoalteromonas luteoviolacea TaxID=43657 RepID=UPI0012DADDD4|nr:FecR domain-containing protein [Pseudoalteromonas luteoviolacea]MBQ4878009.1 FecR domain-containing protein [Pseudoalteromonas luteoviolacea]MBQ4907137.1 FecR domain-containing protein [Pseudoalteromonas luteoviolacea]MCF6439130.1 FecR domain-containing protein [Pseudoalteromonas luteoviolacea]
MNNQQPDKRLLREAFDLVVAVYDDPKSRSQLDAWRKQSPMHEQAAAKAEADWAILGLVEHVSLSLFDKIKLAIQLRLERFAEAPLKLIPPLGIAMALSTLLYVSVDEQAPTPIQPSVVKVVTPTSKPKVSTKHYQTAWGQQQTVELEDGTEVWLDWSTDLKVSMTDSSRHVSLLSGKALFSVQPDPNRPFTVTSDSAVATVLGTQFVVSKLDHQAVEIEVLSGAVGVSDTNHNVTKQLGESDVVRVTDGKLSEVKTRPLAEIGAWRDGIIVFEQRPLIEALEVLQPYTSYLLDTRYIYDGERPVSGTFILNKGDDALRAIMQSYRLSGDVEGRNTLVLRSETPQRPL